MMTDSVEGEGSDGGGSGKQERRVTKHAWPWAQARADPAEELDQAWEAAYHQARAANAHARAYNHAQTYAHFRSYVSLSVKASGLLALLLSTVILLGGYVQSLKKQDFFCIMAITVIQAAGIFQDWETNLEYLLDFFKLFDDLMLFLGQIPALQFAILPFFTLIWWVVLLFYIFGPLVCLAFSSCRIAKLNHGNNKDADMMAALNIFYSLIIFQGTMFLVLLLPMNIYRAFVAHHLHSLEQLSEKWGKNAIGRYIYDISKKCRKDPPSIKGMDLIKYGAELLDSESQEDYLYGARLLSAFVNKGEDVSWVLLPSRHRIQRLIDSLVIRSSSSGGRLDEVVIRRGRRCYAVIGSDEKKEIRELAARIVADVAVHIDDLSNYPGAMRCICSLLQHQEKTTQQTYRNQKSKQVPEDLPQHQGSIGTKEEKRMKRLIRHEETRQLNLLTDQNRMKIREHRHRHKKDEGGTSNELVLQGLTILERLASNSDDNRSIICSAPGLLPKITSPVYSATLIQDVKNKAWADIVTRCLKVLYQLIRDPGHQIFSKHQALSNLKNILLEVGNDEADHQELQLVTMDILTELSMDLSINLSDEIKTVVMKKQLQLFLLANGDDQEDSAAIAGRAMVSLSTNSESNSELIMTMENGIIGRLTGILEDDNENITRRTIAADIAANLCAHCTVDNMDEILPKVLREIMAIKRKSQEREESRGQNNPASGDEENQGNSVSTNNEERHNISTQDDDTESVEISDQEREEQEAFLSLAQVICDKLNSADLDGAIQNAVDQNMAGSEEQRREAFVDKLKSIIDDNCHATAECLRIVKLCGQIAKSVMRCEQYVEIFRNKGFKGSLSQASKTMSELESCMLFVGTDFRLKKTVRPLFSQIEKTWSEM